VRVPLIKFVPHSINLLLSFHVAGNLEVKYIFILFVKKIESLKYLCTTQTGPGMVV